MPVDEFVSVSLAVATDAWLVSNTLPRTAPFWRFCASAVPAMIEKQVSNKAKNTGFRIFIATLPIRDELFERVSKLLGEWLRACRFMNLEAVAKDTSSEQAAIKAVRNLLFNFRTRAPSPRWAVG